MSIGNYSHDIVVLNEVCQKRFSCMNKGIEVKRMYEQYPFPNQPSNLNDYKMPNTILDVCTRDRYTNHKVSNFLDAGCGTGEVTCGLAKRMPNSNFVGIDFSNESIRKAWFLARKLKLKNIIFQERDVMSFNSLIKYDEIISLGVLHHTNNAETSFHNLAGALDNEGYITIALYNTYARALHRLKRLIVALYANTLKDKIRAARRLGFARNESDALVADSFAHPNENYFRIKDVMKWFRANNIEYSSSFPPIELCYYPRLLFLDLTSNTAYRNIYRKAFLRGKMAKRFWYNPFFYWLVELLWVFYLGNGLFHIEGRRNGK